jgi:hypothetical protein
VAERISGNALRSPEAIHEALKEYEEIGLDELILDPTGLGSLSGRPAG